MNYVSRVVVLRNEESLMKIVQNTMNLEKYKDFFVSCFRLALTRLLQSPFTHRISGIVNVSRYDVNSCVKLSDYAITKYM